MKKTLSLILSMLMLLSVFSVTAFAAEAPALKALKCTFDGIEITWSAAKDAANYVVYRSEGIDGEEAVIAATTATKYVDKNVEEGVAYTYKVTAQATDGSFTTPDTAVSRSIVYVKPYCAHANAKWEIVQEASVYNSGSKTKVCPVCKTVLETKVIPQLVPQTPVIKGICNRTNGVVFNWTVVDGATSYNVYRRAEGGKWVLLATISGTRYVDSKAVSGVSYSYTVRARNAAGLSAYDPGKTIRYVAAPTNIKASNGLYGVYVAWNSVKAATSYRVYTKVAGEEGWTCIGTTTKTNFYHDEAVPGEDYIYTVVAVCKGKFSSFYDDAFKIRRLERPVLAKSVSSKEGITTTWEPVDGAQGYNVYRKTANSGWILLGKVNNTRSTAYLDKSTKKGVTYTYTVRAYGNSSISYYYNGISCKDVH